MTRIATTVAVLGISALVTLTTSCGSDSQANPAATPTTSAATGNSTQDPSATAGSNQTQTEGTTGQSPTSAGIGGTPATAAALPDAPYSYGELLLAAWATGDRAAAARYATPDAVAALFGHKPIAELVNFECGDGNPVVCGWIGAEDAQVILGLDQAKLTKKATQAVVSVKVTTN